MNDNDGRRHQTFVRVREFFGQRARDFSETGAALQLINELTALITDLDAEAAAQAASTGQARQHTQSRREARLALREDVEAINRIARTMGLQNQFPLPSEDNDKLLLNAARGYATNALPLKAQFIAREMPADFIEDLNADITALETTIAQQGNAVGDRTASGAGIEDKVDRGMEILRELRGIVQVKYANNPAVLAEWTSASHVEKAPRRAAAAGGSTPAKTAGTEPGSGSSTPPAA
jgi:hypothetical protein